MADALGRTTRYGRCRRRERQVISQASTLIDVPAGAVLPQHGRRQFAIVLTGAATLLADDGRESALLAGDHFGEGALLGVGPSDGTVVAATPMSLAVVAPTEFHVLLERSPALLRAVLDGLAHRLRLQVAA